MKKIFLTMSLAFVATIAFGAGPVLETRFQTGVTNSATGFTNSDDCPVIPVIGGPMTGRLYVSATVSTTVGNGNLGVWVSAASGAQAGTNAFSFPWQSSEYSVLCTNVTSNTSRIIAKSASMDLAGVSFLKVVRLEGYLSGYISNISVRVAYQGSQR